MMNRKWLVNGLIASCITTSVVAGAQTPPTPEPPLRELRGVWISTVYNLDWPDSRFSSTAQGQSQIRTILDKMVDLNMNCIVFQVRSGGDAMYSSTKEPWSRWLTGTEGNAPSPAWDPLQYVLDQAHSRGIEVHAWFNPYRASVSTSFTHAANHITRTRPDLIRTFDNQRWFDPGEPDTVTIVTDIVMDVVRRYDIDGVHFDDYFYPYDAIDGFPDESTYQDYLNGGGTSDLEDWRRENTDSLIKGVYDAIKAEKPEVRFGLSPFGIWRSGNPEGVIGYDYYSRSFADTRKWLREGWVDYYTPQIYWEIDPPEQSYTALMDWWIEENYQNRHIWPGLALYKLSDRDWPANEIVRQIEETQARTGATGTVGFRWDYYGDNYKNIANLLKQGPWSEPALVPASTWLDDEAPNLPEVTIDSETNTVIRWTPQGSEDAFRWVVYTYRDGAWSHTILNESARSYTVPNSQATPPSHIAVTAVDRLGNESSVVVQTTSDDRTEGWFLF